MTGQGPVILYASTNLAVWQPILTNAAVTGTLEFQDASAANFAWRFYRASESR